MRLIDAENLEEVLNRYLAQLRNSGISVGLRMGINTCLTFINNANTIEAEPVKHGHWVAKRKEDCFDGEEPFEVGMENGEPLASCYCSECGEWLVASDEYSVKGRYCPNCGAKMESDGE